MAEYLFFDFGRAAGVSGARGYLASEIHLQPILESYFKNEC